MSLTALAMAGTLPGRNDLGRIVGIAQTMTVLASAVGPLVLAKFQTTTGSYAAVFHIVACLVAVLAFAASTVKVPHAKSRSTVDHSLP